MRIPSEKPFVVIAASGVIETALLPYHLVHLKAHYNLKTAVAITPNGYEFATCTALRAISQHPVYDKNASFDTASEKPWHIVLSGADLLVLYPASARVIAQCANGEITCPVTRLFAFTEKARIVICPALHPRFDMRIYIRHLDILENLGCHILARGIGERLELPSWDIVEAFVEQKLNIERLIPRSEVTELSRTE
jgi:phosphopantothenoylcysteine synthetase/decarboxylase